MHLGEYLKIMLIKKKMSGQDLSNLLNSQKDVNVRNDGNATVTRFQVSAWINGKENISPLMARRIEMALGLKENSFVDLVNIKGNGMAGYNKVFGKKEDENG